MKQALNLLATVIIAVMSMSLAVSVYDPYMDAAELYRMQLLNDAFEYPADKLDLEGLGGGALDVPYGLMNGAGDRYSEMEDETGPAYWPEELVAELAAAAENERNGFVMPQQAAEEEESSEQVAAEEDKQNVDEEANIVDKPAEGEKEEEKAEEELHKGKTKYSSAQLRDQEHLEHSALHGYQSVSGGTVNGQNKQAKTDKALPAYCNPPNPCPVGKTAADNCVENFENSAENNQRLLSEQECPCDTEHMFTCPEGSQTVSSKAQGSGAGGAPSASGASSGSRDAAEQMQINKVIAELSGMSQDGDNMMSTQKRVTLVAKKSPHFIGKRSEKLNEINPYLTGDKINIAAKKDPNLAQKVLPEWELQ